MNASPTTVSRVPLALFAAYVALFVWSTIAPYDRTTWWVEIIPIMALVGTLVTLYLRGVRFPALGWLLMAVLPFWHTIGAHYTFERVPFGWVDRFFGFERNMFDRVGHFSVGFFAYGIADLLLQRRAMSRRLAYSYALFAIGFVAMGYELIEWGYAAYGGNAEAGANFLGSQGDIWDAQKDMLMDTLGACTALAVHALTRRPDQASAWR